jgi:hypothetical protein
MILAEAGTRPNDTMRANQLYARNRTPQVRFRDPCRINGSAGEL